MNAAPRPSAITATEPIPVSAATTAATPGATPGASAGTGTGTGTSADTAPDGLERKLPPLYPHMMKRAPRERSASEMANEQLNGNRTRDRFGQAMEEAGAKDCLKNEPAGMFRGLFALPGLVARAAQGKCPQ